MKKPPNLIFIATSVTILILTFVAVMYIGHRGDPLQDEFSRDSLTQEPPPAPLSVTNTPEERSMQVSDSSLDSSSEYGQEWSPEFEEAPPQGGTEPVIMTDYKNWTIIAEQISLRNGYSVGTGKTGITHRDGMFITASAGFISHSNQDGQINMIYIPQAARIKLPGGQVFISTDTEMLTRVDGTYTIHSDRSAMFSALVRP